MKTKFKRRNNIVKSFTKCERNRGTGSHEILDGSEGAGLLKVVVRFWSNVDSYGIMATDEVGIR